MWFHFFYLPFSVHPYNSLENNSFLIWSYLTLQCYLFYYCEHCFSSLLSLSDSTGHSAFTCYKFLLFFSFDIHFTNTWWCQTDQDRALALQFWSVITCVLPKLKICWKLNYLYFKVQWQTLNKNLTDLEHLFPKSVFFDILLFKKYFLVVY